MSPYYSILNSAKIETRTNFKFYGIAWMEKCTIIDTSQVVYGDNAQKKSVYKWVTCFKKEGEMMLKMKPQWLTIHINLQGKNQSCLCPNWRGLTINSRNNSQHHTYLNWFSLHNSDWKTKVKQTWWVLRLLLPDQLKTRAELSVETLSKWSQESELH